MDENLEQLTVRERAVLFLYQLELTEKNLEEIFTYTDTKIGNAERALVEKVWEKQDHLDDLIQKTSTEWKLERIGYVELSVLRLALYEIIYTENPVPVVINAAVEIAKRYSGEEAGRFVNGVLGRAVREQDEK